ncbi:ABC-type polysaccharide/polyol phosphate export permease [Bradyrhizobium sp. CIR18]|uniref:ABC transporter permease n=1 Tax=Bradyrhizobium sp. CIR18 TaxID=2663839 RepID=UPI001605CE9C|nr:ABC transporter permease [Bradyrhizobium sp. CIR18]MBB4361479.1 ABC-type polysaccharide/polyol phosphate export permease [Bradyrhizobium sp. CIR18]
MTIVLTPVEDEIGGIKDTDVSLRSLEISAAEDLWLGLFKRELWGRLGWLDVKRRYRRTTIGPFWTSITLAIYTFSVGFVGAALWHQDIFEYLPFLVSGMVVWMLVSSIAMESCNMFIAGQALFRNIRFEYSILAYALVWRNFLVLLHNFVVYFLVVVALKPSLLSFTLLLVFPGLALVILNGVWISLFLGLVCLRFRDVPQLVSSAIQISMLVTPLFWPADTLTGMRRILFVESNPLYHVIDVVRGPLVGRVPGAISYVVMIVMCIGGWWLTYAMFKRFRRRIAYWS